MSCNCEQINYTLENCPQDCIKYSGENLPCTGVNTGDTFDTVLSKIDQTVCQISGDYSGYNTNCLSTDPINTENQFVDLITLQFCQLKNDYDFFVNTTFEDFKQDTNDKLNGPANVVCATASVVSTDTNTQIFQKYCTTLTNIKTSLDISGVNFSQCFTTSTPTTIASAFTNVLNQICQLKSYTQANLIIDNTDFCQSGGTAIDTLLQTINLMKTKICSIQEFKVKASGADTSGDFLVDKIQGKTTPGLSLVTSYNTLTKKVDITPSFDFDSLAASILTSINNNQTLLDQFCVTVASCG